MLTPDNDKVFALYKLRVESPEFKPPILRDGATTTEIQERCAWAHRLVSLYYVLMTEAMHVAVRTMFTSTVPLMERCLDSGMIPGYDGYRFGFDESGRLDIATIEEPSVSLRQLIGGFLDRAPRDDDDFDDFGIRFEDDEVDDGGGDIEFTVPPAAAEDVAEYDYETTFPPVDERMGDEVMRSVIRDLYRKNPDGSYTPRDESEDSGRAPIAGSGDRG